ncbi:MFS transporter [Amycolatopsis sp. NPDC057786]|uniref:MFS transporter n=1 Tax=Amycolatopsis sp. NPDC057786 TaxID=3346250 RepID=UPI00366B2C9F
MIWRDPKSRTVLGSILLSSVGVGVYVLALGQLLFTITGTPLAFAVVVTAQGIGAIAVLPFAGPLVDGLRSQRVYAICSFSRAIVVLAIAVAGAGAVPHAVPLITVAALVLAMLDNVQRTALFKFIAHHVSEENKVKVNGLSGAAIQVGVLGGMALLGLVLTVGTAAHALLLTAAGSAGAAVWMSTVRLDKAEGRGALSSVPLRAALPAAVRDWRQMLRQYRGELVVFGMLVLCAADFVAAHSLSTLVVPLVADHYGGQSWFIAALEATFGIGMLAASVVTRYTVTQRLLPVWVGVQAAMALLLSASSQPVVHFLGYFVVGFANFNSLTWLITTLQQHAGDADKAKMASLRLLSIGLGTALLMPLIGGASQVSLGSAFVGLAAVLAAFTLCGLWVALGFRPKVPVTR